MSSATTPQLPDWRNQAISFIDLGGWLLRASLVKWGFFTISYGIEVSPNWA